MKVGVIGSGVVGQTLAAGFLKHGHEVAVGTRDPAKLKDWQAKNKGAAVKSFAEAAAFGDVVVLAVAGEVALDALKQAGAAALKGKTVIDACNPIGGGPPVNGVLSFFTTMKNSLMERLQKAYPEANFVKAFNSVGAGQMVNPHFAGGRPTMFICGADANAKNTVAESAISSAGTPRTWARSRRRARSNRCACCGASRASARATGRRTRSSCCANRDCGVGRRSAPLRRASDACSWLFGFLSVRAPLASGLRRGIEDRAQFSRDFSLRVGLGQELHARVKPPVLNDGVSSIARREKHGQSRAQGGRLDGERSPVYALGENDIGEEDVDLLAALKPGERFCAIARGEDRIAQFAEQGDSGIAHILVVLDDQHDFAWLSQRYWRLLTRCAAGTLSVSAAPAMRGK